ncbi:MAG: hypothetical protein PQJ44_10210 [Sphaerochaetaceae bacterium]|nr:hypothetical protein [Sphaerochaetaceae bacterium]
MKIKKTKDIILDYILNNYDKKTPIFVKDIYKKFPDISQGTIRSLFKRLSESKQLEKINNGVYSLPNKDSILGKPSVYVNDVIQKKYILNDSGQRIGYESGINFANKLGLTSQTASVSTIYSNQVSNKKRETKLKNNRLIVNAPRVLVNDKNYKLLQVLDLLNNFDKYSEYDLKISSKKILDFISTIDLDENTMEDIVSAYPLEAQVKFYKIGRLYATTQS